MKNARLFALILVLFSLAWHSAISQTVVTGTYALGSFAGGPDNVNLGNLNLNWQFPIMNKAGRGQNFVFNLAYDSSIWYPATVSGSQVWTPVSQWGWSGLLSSIGATYYAYTTTVTNTSQCPIGPQPPNGPPPLGTLYTDTASNFVYVDASGTKHPFSGFGAGYFVSPGGSYGCPPSGLIATTTPTTISATDGSGLTATYYEGSNNKFVVTITTPSGATITPTDGPGELYGSTTYTSTDNNGNQITGAAGVYTDTLGQTALTVVGSSPSMVMSYTNASGAPEKYTVTYSPQMVQTNFQCSTVTDYPPTQQNLISSITIPDGRQYTFTYEGTTGHSPNVTGRIKQITLPTGGTISYTYTGSNNGIECSDGSAAGLTRTTPDGEWAYSRAGSGNQWTTTVTAPTYQGVQDKTVVNFLTSSGTAPYYFYEISRQNYSGTSNLLETILHCYETTSTNCSATLGDSGTSVSVPIQDVTTTYQWPNNTGISSGTYDTYDSFGNNALHEVFDYGSTGSGTYSTTPLQQVFSGYTTWLNSSGAPVQEVPSQVTVEDGASNIIAQTKYTYGTSVTTTSGTPSHVAAPSPFAGNLTSVQRWVSGSTYQTSSYTYFDTGNVQTATDVNGAQTTNTYGACGNSFPTQVSSQTGGSTVLSLTTSETWNCVGGVPLTTVDANGNTTSYAYGSDPYWRPVSATSYYGTSAAITASFAYPTGTSSSNYSSSSMSFNGGSSASNSTTYYDGLGRTILLQTQQGPGSSSFDTVATAYDSRGRTASQTLPYATTPDDPLAGEPGTSYTYDALNRTTAVTDGGGGTTQYTYTANDVLIKSGPQVTLPSTENYKQRNLEYNGAGWLTSVCEITSLSGSGACVQANAQTGYFTKYTYDGGGRLKQVQQNSQTGSSGVQTRLLAYDGLNRKTSETIPEWSAGTGAAGTANYSYDTATSSCSGASTGDLIQSVDNVGNTTCYTYDLLHRKTSAVVTSSSPYGPQTPAAYYVYDAATYSGTAMQNARGALAEAYTCLTSACASKLTDILSSAAPVSSGPMQGGVQAQMWESTPHSGGYFLTTDTYYPNGAVGSVSASLVGASAGSTTNLIQDSTQVGGGSGWGLYCAGNSNGFVMDTTTVPAPDGTYTASQFTMPSSYTCGSSNPYGALTNVPGGLTAGDTYTVSVWLRGAAAGNQVAFGLNDCAGTTVTLTTSWQRYTATFSSISSAVANCSTGARGFQFTGGPVNSTFYIWGPQTMQSATEEPYVATTDGGANYIGIPDLTFGVDGEGRPYSASDGTYNLVTATAYNPASAATSVTYGNAGTGSANDVDTFGYDPNTYRPTSLTYAINPSSNPYSVTTALTWNPNGSLQKMVYTDGSPTPLNQTCNYSADDLRRISSVNCGSSTWAQNFTYDAFGNINKANAGGAITYNAAYTAVTNQVAPGSITPTPTYDKNGNQLTSTPATLTWNAWNVPIKVNSTSATYDALGRMVEKGVGSTYTQFVFRPSGANLAVYSGSLTKGTVPLPGGNTAVYNSSGLSYIRHTDWLGSSRFATTWAHAVYSKTAYAPFGETYNEWAQSGTTPDRSFTGQDQDVATGAAGGGVYDFLFRKYDPSAGRWLSPDPAGWGVVNQDDPRSLDRYAYVENQPMNAVDPDGLLLCIANAVSADGTLYGYDSGDSPCAAGYWSYSVSQTVTVNSDDCSSSNPSACPPTQNPNFDPSDRSYQLAVALQKTGVYSLASWCAPVQFFAASATAAYSGVAAGAGYGGVETAELAQAILPSEEAVMKAVTKVAPAAVFAWATAEVTGATDWAKEKVRSAITPLINRACSQ